MKNIPYYFITLTYDKNDLKIFNLLIITGSETISKKI